MTDRDLAVIVPVLWRPERVVPTIESVEAATPNARLVFVVSARDRATQAALADTDYGGRWMGAIKDHYAYKINEAAELVRMPLLFLGADDLDYRPGWFDKAVAHMEQGAEVVGVNDLMDRPRRRRHATHFLMTRDYAERPLPDGSRGPLFEGYHHWYCDDELIARATADGVYAYAPDAHVEHLHYLNGKADDDDTYRRGRKHRRADRRTFTERSHLWASP